MGGEQGQAHVEDPGPPDKIPEQKGVGRNCDKKSSFNFFLPLTGCFF